MTKLNYLDDTYLFESKATFIEIRENEKGEAVILDETIFYPQGGGQPADTGKIILDNIIFSVTDVRLDENGIVWHFGKFQNGGFNKNDKVILKIDSDRRLINTKLHSAGHLLDCAVIKMGIKNITATKGFHFPNGPSVEYNGTIENSAEIIPELEKIVNELIVKNLQIEKQTLSSDEAKKQGVWAPEGKSARIVNFEGFPNCGCGGTHVKSSSEIGQIIIRKIKSKKGITKISYSVE